MGVPTPVIPTFTDGQVVHAADLNALGSNLTNLYTYNNAGFTTQKPTVIATQTTGQTISPTTETLITFQSTSINTDNMWVAGNPSQLTIQHAGVYFIFGQVRWPSTSGATLNNGLIANILANGTSITNAISVTASPMLSVTMAQQVFAIANLAAGATLYLDVWHNSTGSMTLATDRGGSFLSAFFITPST